MPFWGSSSNDKSDHSSEASFTSDDAAFGTGQGPSSMGGGASASASDMQQFAVAMQQQVLVQTIISNLTETAFEKCITSKPGDSLSGKEVACIHATVNKMMDTNEFMMGRLAKKQQSAAGSAGYQ
mmetsp:Transcript_2476/g.3649  ORF Transcript_2476/g.3649 Transcript_2476/m.3649 type:complete len:125 (-) Transcript_2476:119-493(-)|eukprot:CAMPEP_0194201044 /NCGR_PEP_ID=MMETSP0156-20130528/1427_1 /TAXON_ID=33649 /ORGANISM="Thalassionema nitzschioides, Strain L26-B" /LENGTH=124 /DNA_ID=CAMNT_0038926145 /DNA_START=62 /DNA_END=436 /DNA_ORIENTATION=-